MEAEQAPEVLKEAKDKISSEYEEGTKECKDPEKINIYEQIIHGKADTAHILKQATENFAKRKVSKIKDVHELSQAIILTNMAQQAD